MPKKDDETLPEGPINAGRPAAPAPEFPDPAKAGLLAFRDPAWLWAPAALIVSPWLGAVLPALALAAPEIAGGGAAVPPVIDGLRALGMFGLAAACLPGGLWFLATRNRGRRRRLMVAAECGVIGLVFAVLLGVGAAATAFLQPSSATPAEAAAGAVKIVGVFAGIGLAVGLPTGLLAGVPFSLFAFRRG
jgi:hypothetical protein